MKVLVATDKPFAKEAVKAIEDVITAAGHELVLLEKYTQQSDLVAAVADVNAVIIRSDLITAEVLAAAPQLKIVVRAGAGYDNVDLAVASANGVVVENTPGQNANAVAELAFGMMVSLARNNYDTKMGSELRGKTLGIHAFGNIGRYVAEVAKGFGMEVLAFDPFVNAEVIAAAGVTPVASVTELYTKSQYVSLHIPATADTKKSINKSLLSLMPKGATLVNTARKEVIDEAQLSEVFAERADFRYATDIAPATHAELAEKYPTRYFATAKKLGAQTAEANFNAGVAAAKQIVAFFATGDITYKVN
jgi:D-3-phosphoglycerate dehydrogenase